MYQIPCESGVRDTPCRKVLRTLPYDLQHYLHFTGHQHTAHSRGSKGITGNRAFGTAGARKCGLTQQRLASAGRDRDSGAGRRRVRQEQRGASAAGHDGAGVHSLRLRGSK